MKATASRKVGVVYEAQGKRNAEAWQRGAREAMGRMGNNAQAQVRVTVSNLNDLMDSDRRDLLSICLDVDPANPENQHSVPAYKIWARHAVKEIVDGLPRSARRSAKDVVARILAYVDALHPKGRSVALFPGKGFWREYVLPVPIRNRIRYGRPDVLPILWALDEYKPYAILAAYHDHASLFRASLGRTALILEETLDLDTSDWRFASGRQPTRARAMGTGAGRGLQGDTFEARVDERVHRFWSRVAETAARLLDDLSVDRLVIAGPEEGAHAIRASLPAPSRPKVVGLLPLPSYAGWAEIRDRTLPLALAEEHRRDTELVRAVVEGAASNRGAVRGTAATLYALMQGQARAVVMQWEFDDMAWECVRCGYVDVAGVDACPTCGGPMEATTISLILPRLVRRCGAEFQLVDTRAASGFHPHEPVGALLRYAGTPVMSAGTTLSG